MLTALFDGKRVCAPYLSDNEWREIDKAAHEDRSRLVNPITGNPMYCTHRTSMIGSTRYFAMMPGYANDTGLTEPETIHHIQLKEKVVEAAKELGFDADVEVPVNGRAAVADVLIQRPGLNPLAVEIQWSRQTDYDYDRRTLRYREHGIDCIWIERRPEQFDYSSLAAPCLINGGVPYVWAPGSHTCVRPIGCSLRLPLFWDEDYDSPDDQVLIGIYDRHVENGWVNKYEDVKPDPELLIIKVDTIVKSILTKTALFDYRDGYYEPTIAKWQGDFYQVSRESYDTIFSDLRGVKWGKSSRVSEIVVLNEMANKPILVLPPASKWGTDEFPCHFLNTTREAVMQYHDEYSQRKLQFGLDRKVIYENFDF